MPAQLDPKLTKQHLKAVIFRSYIVYVKKFHPDIDISALCESAGLPLTYLLNDNNWVSIEFESRLINALKEKIPDENFLYEVGFFGVRPEVVGRVIHYLSAVLSLSTIYQQLPKITAMLNKVVEVRLKSVKGHDLQYTITPRYELLNKGELLLIDERMLDFLENTRGYYSAIPTQFGLSPSKVQYRKLEGGSYELAVSYPNDIIDSNRLVYLVAFGLGVAAMLLSFFALDNDLENSLLWGFGVIGLVLSYSMFKRFNQAMSVAKESTENLVALDEQYKVLNDTKSTLQRRLQEANAVRQIVESLIHADSEEELLFRACKSLTENLNFDRSLILLANSEMNKLKYTTSFGVEGPLLKLLTGFILPADIPSSDPKKIANVFRLNIPVLIEDVKKHLPSLQDEDSRKLLSLAQSTSFIAVPIRTDASRVGVLIADCTTPSKTLTADDVEVLKMVGNQIALAVERGRAEQNVVEALKKQKDLTKAYSRFVPLESLNYLGYRDVFDVKLGDGAERNLTVLFSDIRDFSSLCESMSPGDTLRFLNSYFGRLSPTVRKYNGVVDKFIGDCIMAIFNNPIDAIRAAVEFQRDLVTYNLERRIGGRRLVDAGIGICTGPVIMGPLGSEEKIEITVLSDTVNIASRLDNMCKDLHSRILVSGFSLDLSLVREGCFEIDHGDLPIKGKDRYVRVIEVVDPRLVEFIQNSKFSKDNDEAQKYLKKVTEEVERKKEIRAFKKKTA
jgi:class 3 adenylate cyclase